MSGGNWCPGGIGVSSIFPAGEIGVSSIFPVYNEPTPISPDCRAIPTDVDFISLLRQKLETAIASGERVEIR